MRYQQRPEPFPWDENHIVELLKRHHEGQSSFQIGMALGVTRNSVIGKLNRMKRRGTMPPPPRAIKQTAPAKPKPILAPPAPPEPVPVIWGDISANLSNVRPNGCKWICDPIQKGFADLALMCNHPRLENSPWCAKHRAQAYIPNIPRKRKYRAAHGHR